MFTTLDKIDHHSFIRDIKDLSQYLQNERMGVNGECHQKNQAHPCFQGRAFMKSNIIQMPIS
jgi:hypothetical protein